jgi:phosphate/phosphite/phosphonate ABC transporter binding protein
MLALLAVLGCQPAKGTPDPPDARLNEQLAEGRVALMAADVGVLRLAVHPVLDEDGTLEAWSPLMSHVSELLGVPIELSLVQGYGQIEQLILSGELDGGLLTAFDYVHADELLDLHVVATPIVGGSLTYHAYVVALADQPVRDINGLADLEGLPVSFVDPRSTSGWAYPAAMMVEAGLDPFQHARFQGSHMGVVASVEEGSVLAGAIYGGLYQGDPLRIVAKSDPIPYDAMVLRGGLPVEASEALGAALNSIDSRTERGRLLLEPLSNVNGFVAVGSDHYDGVRAVHRTLEAAQ